jgi:hypothetical protein
MCGVWFVRVIGGVSGWCVVCVRNGMKNGFVMTNERANGRYELWSSMKHDEFRYMGHFVPIRKKFIKNTIKNMPHFLKIAYF